MVGLVCSQRVADAVVPGVRAIRGMGYGGSTSLGWSRGPGDFLTVLAQRNDPRLFAPADRTRSGHAEKNANHDGSENQRIMALISADMNRAGDGNRTRMISLEV